jgi:hypothetical protein
MRPYICEISRSNNFHSKADEKSNCPKVSQGPNVSESVEQDLGQGLGPGHELERQKGSGCMPKYHLNP